MLRIFINASILFVTTAANAQLSVPDPSHPPSASQIIHQVTPSGTPAPATPPPPAQVMPPVAQSIVNDLAPNKVVQPVQKTLEHGVKEGEKLGQQVIDTGSQLLQGANPTVPGVGGGPAGCSLDKIVETAKALEGLAKDHADQVKKFNDDMAAAAKNVTEAQANVIKKAVDDAGELLLNPFKPLIKFVEKYMTIIDDIKDKLENIGEKTVAIASIVIGFMIGFPFWVFIRRITPSKPA